MEPSPVKCECHQALWSLFSLGVDDSGCVVLLKSAVIFKLSVTCGKWLMDLSSAIESLRCCSVAIVVQSSVLDHWWACSSCPCLKASSALGGVQLARCRLWLLWSSAKKPYH
eukprot:2123658-Amphidinium_carterae.2